MIPFHVLAGALAILSGAVALAAFKGGPLHRKSGRVFVYAMLVMSASGALMAVLQPKLEGINLIAGTLTFYFVVTAWRAVQRPVLEFGAADGAALAVAVLAGIGGVVFGLEALASPNRAERFMAPPSFLFSFVALLAIAGDVRLLLGRRLQGPPRIARHLWRMCFAAFVAAGSFFTGPPRRLPAFMRGSPLLPVPVLLVLLLMAYWLVRVRLGRRFSRA